MLNGVTITHAFGEISQDEAIPSILLRVTSCALGMIEAGTGTFILAGVPWFSHLNVIIAYSTLPTGSALFLVGIAVKGVTKPTNVTLLECTCDGSGTTRCGVGDARWYHASPAWRAIIKDGTIKQSRDGAAGRGTYVSQMPEFDYYGNKGRGFVFAYGSEINSLPHNVVRSPFSQWGSHIQWRAVLYDLRVDGAKYIIAPNFRRISTFAEFDKDVVIVRRREFMKHMKRRPRT